MSFFDFFRKLSFFKGRSVEGLQEEDLDFQKWIAAHRNWRRRLQDYIDGMSVESLDENAICHDDRCELGKWIHGNGWKFYKEENTFQQLVTDHACFHRSAAEVVVYHKKNDEKSARKTLQGDFDRYSMHVISALERLEKQVKA
jgi:hypothetical protein